MFTVDNINMYRFIYCKLISSLELKHDNQEIIFKKPGSYFICDGITSLTGSIIVLDAFILIKFFKFNYSFISIN